MDADHDTVSEFLIIVSMYARDEKIEIWGYFGTKF